MNLMQWFFTTHASLFGLYNNCYCDKHLDHYEKYVTSLTKGIKIEN